MICIYPNNVAFDFKEDGNINENEHDYEDHHHDDDNDNVDEKT